jgi:Mrp family chromosome partitioning ATPase
MSDLSYYCLIFVPKFQDKLVGVLDADVYGPSIPRLLNLAGPAFLNEGLASHPIHFSQVK